MSAKVDSFMRGLLNLISPSMPIVVCYDCRTPADKALYYAIPDEAIVCDRCAKPIVARRAIAVQGDVLNKVRS
jgi:recombinational DNA repair protein (RecF pathway)